jgi:hypothetical protein
MDYMKLGVVFCRFSGSHLVGFLRKVSNFIVWGTKAMRKGECPIREWVD